MEPTPRGAGRTGSRLHQPRLATGLGREWDLTAVLFPAAEPLRTEPEDKVSGAVARSFLRVRSLSLPGTGRPPLQIMATRGKRKTVVCLLPYLPCSGDETLG